MKMLSGSQKTMPGPAGWILQAQIRKQALIGRDPGKQQSYAKVIDWAYISRRKRRNNDRKLLTCIWLSGLTIIGIGVAMVCVSYFVLREHNPLVLIGPVLMGCGVIVLLLSVEVCMRHRRLSRRIGPDDDDVNDHNIDPSVANYAFGNYPGIDMKSEKIREEREGEVVGDEEGEEILTVGPSSITMTKQRKNTVSPTMGISSDLLSLDGSLNGKPKVSVTPASPPKERKSTEQDDMFNELLLSPRDL